MKAAWDDVNARARGLTTHLLSAAELGILAGATDLASLAAGLRRSRIITSVATELPRPEDLELGLRRWAAGLFRILAHWTGGRTAALPIVFDDEDRRSLQAILRGSVQRAPLDRRLAGLIPTPALPERALAELAGAPTIAAAGALLSAWHHPYAETLAPATAAVHPDSFALDIAVSQAFARQATASARRTHSGAVRQFVQDTIDLENATTAIILAVAGRDVVPRDVFLAGGARLSLRAFRDAIESGAPGTRIATALGDSPYATAFTGQLTDPVALGDDLLRRRLRVLARHVRQEPLDALSPIWFALRLRAQLITLQRIIWTVALNGPRASLTEMITAEAA